MYVTYLYMIVCLRFPKNMFRGFELEFDVVQFLLLEFYVIEVEALFVPLDFMSLESFCRAPLFIEFSCGF